MKLKHIIPFFLAALTFAVVGCSEDEEKTYLDGLRVSQSYVSIDVNGGSTAITIEANADWAFQKIDEAPEWLTVTPVSGGAGSTEITFSAASTDERREAMLKIESAGQTQMINIIQSPENTELVVMTVAEAIALIQANQSLEKNIVVKGVVCKIDEISPQYGNATYYLSDDGSYVGKYGSDGTGDGNWLEVYRGRWIENAKFTSGDEFSVGDELVVSGIIMSYKGIPEMKTGTSQVISHTKSLIKVDSTNVKDNTLPVEGGDIVAYFTNKGTNFSVEIPVESQDWLFIKSFTADSVTLHAVPNTGGDRNATITFKTSADGKDYTSQITIIQKGAIVTATIAEFLAAGVGDTQYRITGIITNVANASYGNVYVRDFSGEVYVYGIGAKGDFEAAGLKEGDIVTLIGKRAEYKESPQMSGGVLESSISVTDVTIDEFLTKEDNPDVYYRVEGMLDEIDNPTYGNLYLKDNVTRLYVYGCYPGWGATGDFRKDCLTQKGIEVGDLLKVIGVKSTYNGTPQLKNGIYFSHQKPEPTE